MNVTTPKKKHISSARLTEVGETISQACATLGLSIEEAFKLIDSERPALHEMHLMPVSVWIKLCDLLCLSYDQAFMKYDLDIHLNIIQYRRSGAVSRNSNLSFVPPIV